MKIKDEELRSVFPNKGRYPSMKALANENLTLFTWRLRGKRRQDR